MAQRLAIIAGTGMDRLPSSLSSTEVTSVRSDTPWGQVPIQLLNIDGCELFLTIDTTQPISNSEHLLIR